jgi:regulator of sigma E protease
MLLGAGLGPKEIVVAIVALCVVIIIHEGGHYLAAVWSGMKVDRFSVFGIGPSILKLGTFRGTEFVISAIPFGAYVLIRGMEPGPPEDPSSSEPPEADSPNFRDKPLLSRMLVIAGGPVANYLLAIGLFVGIFAFAGVPRVHSITVGEFADDSVAAAAGMELGDELVRIGDADVDPAARQPGIVAATEPYGGKPVDIVVRRDGALHTITPTLPADTHAMGVVLVEHAGRQPVPFGEAARLGVTKPFKESKNQLVALGQLFTGKLSTSKMEGPVKIVGYIAKSAEAGVVPLFYMAALISTLLGMFNLLPLPALDGGRLTFLAYEAIARRRANPRVEEMVHGYGMLALLALILLITVGDIRSML